MFNIGVGRSGQAAVFVRSSLLHRHLRPHVRLFSASLSLSAPVTFAKPTIDAASIQSVERCPDPTCECATTPTLEPPIDFKARLTETAPGYTSHVVIATGKSDWTNKIENESALDAGSTGSAQVVGLARGLKHSLGRGGRYFDSSRPVMVTNSSFPLTEAQNDNDARYVSAYLFPQGIKVSRIPDTDHGHDTFVKSFLVNGSAHSTGTQDTVDTPFNIEAITVPTILICSHMSRDARCGILGPLLYREFETQLRRLGISTQAPLDGETREDGPGRWSNVNIAMCSHIGGHKWAGNVIVNMPKSSANPTTLAGKSVWYGRVEPKHVEGIVTTTIISGQVIEELSRGVRA